MAAVRVSTYGKGRAKLIECLREFEPFTTGGAMSGTDIVHTEGNLYFFPEYREMFNSSRDRIKYVVYSYATPIAWVLEDGEIVIPDLKYSTTTSRHQQLCRVYLGAEVDTCWWKDPKCGCKRSPDVGRDVPCPTHGVKSVNKRNYVVAVEVGAAPKKMMAWCTGCNTIWEITSDNFGTTPCDCPDRTEVVIVAEEVKS